MNKDSPSSLDYPPDHSLVYPIDYPPMPLRKLSLQEIGISEHQKISILPLNPDKIVRTTPLMNNENFMPSTDSKSMEPILIVRGIKKSYPDGRVNALKGVSFSVQRGEFLSIMGPSGSGKSTLLNLLGTLDRPDEGEIFIGNESLKSAKSFDRFRALHIGFVFQSFFLLPTLTAIENIQIPMFEGRYKNARERLQKAENLLESVGMMHRRNHRPNQLSVGERQRIALARSLANDPILLLADEPTGNLDSHTAEDILDLLMQIRKDRALTIVMVTHSAEVAHRADRLIVLRDGLLEEETILVHPNDGQTDLPPTTTK